MSCRGLLQEPVGNDNDVVFDDGTNEATPSSLDCGIACESKHVLWQCWILLTGEQRYYRRTTLCRENWRPYSNCILDASKLATKLCIAVLILMSVNLNAANAFGVTCTYHTVECKSSDRMLASLGVDWRNNYHHHRVSIQLTATMDDSSPSEGDVDDPIGEDLDTGGILIEDLSWRVEKLRLEEQNKKRFLTSGPRFLPYNECRKWVQAWGNRWSTEEDWKNWIRMGEKRNPYIPSRPDEYYGRLGHWISWEHFLGTSEDNDETLGRCT